MLLGRFFIRIGTEADAEACQRLTRLPGVREHLPFVMLPTLREAAQRKQLFIAYLDGEIVGFVRWHARRDGINTIHEIAVDPKAHGLGVGRALLYSVPCPIRLKCKADNAQGNAFYAGAGMVQEGAEVTKGGTALIVWRLNILMILCRGGNKDVPMMARDSSMGYGIRHDVRAFDWPYMLDIHWQKYDWQDYMHKVCTYRPIQAMCADYEHSSQRRALYQQIRDLKAAGVLRVKVCPKFNGAVAHIPRWCTVALSVPSSYAGFMPDYRELVGRNIHLLGGTPLAWFGQTGRLNTKSATGVIAALEGAGAKVRSVDGNSHVGAAAKGTYWQGGAWHSYDRIFDHYALSVLSGRNIVSELNRPREMQLSLGF